MPLQLITPPAIEPVTLAEAKAHLKVDTMDDDALAAQAVQGSSSSHTRHPAEEHPHRVFSRP